MPYGFGRIFILFFLFFRRQGFRMITFDRQAGPFQNFNRSQEEVYHFPTPRDPRVGAWGAPNTPKICERLVGLVSFETNVSKTTGQIHEIIELVYQDDLSLEWAM